MKQAYQLETDSLGGNPILGRLNRNTIKALEECGLIHSGKGRDHQTIGLAYP